ncbi:molybdenum cofactor guanylyltransferase [Arthrobacter sp. SO3]|uniref:molybdenum cofactor guanylyltransferase n=1 Tax=Arthrobacter sp. SO3 TaxID=1897057 RepID=UPI001CFF9F16|nr:NTP transferase domain-containing protein [Arthrobacter sp. SO3]MCB5290950.1 Molybdenum cofactor guanylyltransferase [Arthrobacter sp. SO3]
MEFDAVILSGGRSSRLGGVPKSGLMHDGVTLLGRALLAARAAASTAVVGPDPGVLPQGVLSCREDPPYAGPAAAIAAGLSALAQDRGRDPRHRVAAPYTLVLACDMPRAGDAVRVLLEAAAGVPPVDGLVAVSADGRRQPLVALYGTAALQRRIAEAAQRGTLENASVFSLLARLEVREVSVPEGSTDDVDTWDDASALGVTRPFGGSGNDSHDRGRQSGIRPGTPQLNSTLEANGEKPG